jgi:hypothetical protein
MKEREKIVSESDKFLEKVRRESRESLERGQTLER